MIHHSAEGVAYQTHFIHHLCAKTIIINRFLASAETLAWDVVAFTVLAFYS